MSTPETIASPFPREEAGLHDSGQPGWDPWEGPTKPGFWGGIAPDSDNMYSGPVFHLWAGMGSAAAKGEQLLGGALHLAGEAYMSVGQPRVVGAELPGIGTAIEDDARSRAKQLAPNAATVGTAMQTVHSLGEMASTAIVGSALGGQAGAFSLLASTHGYSDYRDLLEQGVDPRTAAEVALVRGGMAGAGAVTPMAFGSSLISRLITGAASNVGFGIVDRASDSALLRHAGYDDMADQEEVFDRGQILSDAFLGSGFGLAAHLHGRLSGADDLRALQQALQNDKTMRDAALTANLGLQDRHSGPGVPVDPGSAAAHTAALEKALSDVSEGRRVDVAGTGVEESSVLTRGGDVNPEAVTLFAKSVKESGLLEEQAKVEQLEAVLGRKLAGEPEPAPQVEQGSAAFMRRLEAEPLEGVTAELAPDPFDDRSVHIQSLRADEPGKGTGPRALQRLGQYADEHGVNMTLEAQPLDQGGITPAKLKALYERAGFQVVREQGGTPLMERPAEGQEIRTSMQGYTVEEHMPTEDEVRATGAEPGDETAKGAAYVSRALELPGGQAKVGALIKEHSGNSAAFIEAVKAYVGEPRAAAGSGETGAAAPTEPGPVTEGHAEPAGEPAGARTAEPTDGAVRGALADRPDLKLPDGKASDLLNAANDSAAQAEKEAPSLFQAAIDCFSRGGS